MLQNNVRNLCNQPQQSDVLQRSLGNYPFSGKLRVESAVPHSVVCVGSLRHDRRQFRRKNDPTRGVGIRIFFNVRLRRPRDLRLPWLEKQQPCCFGQCMIAEVTLRSARWTLLICFALGSSSFERQTCTELCTMTAMRSASQTWFAVSFTVNTGHLRNFCDPVFAKIYPSLKHGCCALVELGGHGKKLFSLTPLHYGKMLQNRPTG